MTGKDFELVKEGGTITGLAGATQSLGGIKGVRSTSSLEPFKKGGFREPYEKFDKAEKYSSWEFVYEAGQARAPAAGQAGQPGQPPLPGTAQPGQPAGGPSDSPFPPTSGTIDTQNPFK